MFQTIRGTVKRAAFVRALRLDRTMSGRSVPIKRGRRRDKASRPTLTRAMALALWTANRQWTAASLRADRKTGYVPLRFRKAA